MKKTALLAFVAFFLASSCAISYKFNGASIDYSKVRTIAIIDFTNQATLVYPPLISSFNESLKDSYSKQTRLEFTKRNGDLNIEGEITGYSLTPLAVGSDAYAAETRLTLTARVRFTNNTNHEEDFERTFSANRTFSSTSTFESVQDQLVTELIDEIVEGIYNATVANW